LDRKTTRLQPDIRCEGKAKSGLSDAAVVTMGGLVKDLQTFFRQQANQRFRSTAP